MSREIVAILLCLPGLVFCVRPYTMEFISYSHEFMPNFYERLSLRLYNNSQHLILNGSVILARDLNTMDVSFRMIGTDKRTGRKWKMVDVTVDFCDIIVNFRKKNLINIIFGNMRDFGNFIPKRCPYKKGFDYNIKDFYLEADKFPLNIPNLYLNVSVGLITDKLKFYKGKFEVVVESKLKKL